MDGRQLSGCHVCRGCIHDGHRVANGGGFTDWVNITRRYSLALLAYHVVAFTTIDRHVVGALGVSLCHRIPLSVATTATRGARPWRQWIGLTTMERQLLRHHACVAYSCSIMHLGCWVVGVPDAHVVACGAINGI